MENRDTSKSEVSHRTRDADPTDHNSDPKGISRRLRGTPSGSKSGGQYPGKQQSDGRSKGKAGK